jgi:hypothetical protein
MLNRRTLSEGKTFKCTRWPTLKKPMMHHFLVTRGPGNIGAIWRGKNKARNRSDSHLYNYKMNILEGGCHSGAARFMREVPVCIMFCHLDIFYVVDLLGAS